MMEGVKPARVGIVGAGDVSSLYLLGVRAWPAIELAACADLDASRAAALSTVGGFPAMGVDELLADPSIEVVLNLTPPRAHAAVSRAAIAAGKHVYSEKPLATSRDDGRSILDEAVANGVRVGGAPDTFLGGVLQTARKLIDDGWIGTPVSFSATYMSLGPERWHPDPAGFYSAGGGPMLDMGPYYVTALVSLLGPVSWVSGAVRSPTQDRSVHEGPKAGERFHVTVPTSVHGLLGLVEGPIGHLSVSFDVPATLAPHIEIHGTDGSLSIGDPNEFEGDVLFRSATSGAWVPVPPLFNTTVRRGIGLADMIHGIRSDRPHRASGELALHVLDTMLAVEEAAAARVHLTLESRCTRPAALPLGLREGTLDD